MLRLHISLLVILWIQICDAAESFYSPFTARPLRIRLMNHEQQYSPAKHVATPAEEIAERSVGAPHIFNMPYYQAMQQNDEPIQSYSRTGGSYLQEVRRRMRAGGGKIHTASTALTIPNISIETPDTNFRRLSSVGDARRLFDNEDTGENRTRVNAVRRFTASSPSQRPPVSRNSSLSVLLSINGQTTTISSEHSTTPVKVRPVLPRDDIIPLDDDTDKPKNVSLQPLSELEVKSDFALQKSLQRTTMRTEVYTERPSTTKLKTSTAFALVNPTTTITSTSPIVFTLPTLFPTLPNQQQIGQLPIQPVAPIVNGSLTPGFPTAFNLAQPTPFDRQVGVSPTEIRASTDTETLEQLGCGFDLLTQTCKDVFNLGFCTQCVDQGNIFLHNCKCAAPTPLGRTANALFISQTTPLPASNGFLPTQSGAWTPARN